eukprot:UN20200
MLKIGGCFNFLKMDINMDKVDNATLKFKLSDRERIFKFESGSHPWYVRLNKTIRIRLTKGEVFAGSSAKLLFSSPAKLYRFDWKQMD